MFEKESVLSVKRESDSTMNEKIMKDKPLVLVAEDDDSSFILLQLLLRDDYQIERAVNGLETVRMVKEGDFDAVLMDVRMPRMDGMEALRQIRKFNPTIPIIMQTVNVFDSDRRGAIVTGCSAFLTKPIVFDQLRETLKNVLGGGKIGGRFLRGTYRSIK